VTIEFPKSKCRGKCLGKGTCYNKDNESTQCPDCKGSGKLLQSINYKDNIQPKATWGKLFTAYQQIFDADVPFNDADDSRATEIFKRYGLATIAAGVVVVGAWYLWPHAVAACGPQLTAIYTNPSATVLNYLGLTTKTAAASAQAAAVGTATKTATDAAIIAQATAGGTSAPTPRSPYQTWTGLSRKTSRPSGGKSSLTQKTCPTWSGGNPRRCQ